MDFEIFGTFVIGYKCNLWSYLDKCYQSIGFTYGERTELNYCQRQEVEYTTKKL